MIKTKIKNRIARLRDKLYEYNLDGFLIPSNDEFQSEYLPESLNRLKFITGFSGSHGLALITKTSALFFTDGRYLLQAGKELADVFIIHDLTDMLNYIPKDIKIGYDPKLHSINNIDRYKEFYLEPCKNLVDLIWEDRPAFKNSQIFDYPLKYAGRASSSKCQKIQEYLGSKQIDALIITDSASVCWLLNIRAHDIDYNPILLSYLIFYQDGRWELFSRANNSIPFTEFPKKIALLQNKTVQIDPNSASVWLRDQLDNPILLEDPCLLAKACKNNIEIKQVKQVHVIDGVALSKLLYWLEKNDEIKSELSIAAKLLEFRQENTRFMYPSFASIAAFADHGAIIHYHPTLKSNKTLSGNGLFLLDSGGQYWGGTTDITRVIPIGKPSIQQKIDFTLVLKGHIALANAIFPESTTGAELDCIARYPLWQKCKSYAHGTGHGVGSCLSVHEGPQRIGKYGKVALMPGMIISNEPGYYKNGEYGIRIENLMLVKQHSPGFLSMETLSLAPIDKRLILTKMLSQDEQKWLKNYHQKVYKKLSPFLSNKEKIWLKYMCLN